MIRTKEQKYIFDMLKAKGVKKSAIHFYLDFLDTFKISDPIVSTSKKLAAAHGVSERTIQRHIKELSEFHNYIHVKPHYNNDNPDKPYREYNTYYKTPLTEELINNAGNYAKHDIAVNFKKGAFD